MNQPLAYNTRQPNVSGPIGLSIITQIDRTAKGYCGLTFGPSVDLAGVGSPFWVNGTTPRRRQHYPALRRGAGDYSRRRIRVN